MTNSYENTKFAKLKKNIKWYTYVDSSLDLKLKMFMEEYGLNNQARIIRNLVNYCIDYVEEMFKKNSHIDPQIYNEKKIDKLIRDAIKTYEISNGFYEELKQKLSPLKVSLLMLNNYIEEKNILKDGVQNAIDALGELEISVNRHFEEPNIIRFVKKIDLLYIEDNELERKTIDHFFRENRVNIKSVETSDEALYILKTITPKAILLDINLKTSNINGDQLCQMLKANSQYNSIPIILISAVFSKNREEKILTETKADEIIFKPINRLKDLNVLFKYFKDKY